MLRDSYYVSVNVDSHLTPTYSPSTGKLRVTREIYLGDKNYTQVLSYLANKVRGLENPKFYQSEGETEVTGYMKPSKTQQTKIDAEMKKYLKEEEIQAKRTEIQDMEQYIALRKRFTNVDVDKEVSQYRKKQKAQK